ncbi:hypothetical protein AAFF_G00017430 [Aldrovandia affinis]|uniref:RBR-type E3 ubiquitin transferase n=1 Tax=Aldrovandia affinis TaxID=143900 RepID=A0AAD7S5M6_9TELE|nr:hypothetical protein AAFF_G00017430 [Aldrovandia affinis]
MNMSSSLMPTQCPRCQQDKAKIVGDQRAVCRLCSKALSRVYQFCWACQREWQGETGSDSCDLPGCGLRAALLSSDVITEPESCVQGCPFFRACPSCKALLTHSGEGCPNIMCPQCNKEFCFRCLQEECYAAGFGDFEDDDDDDDESDYHNEDYDYIGVHHDYNKPCTMVDNNQAITALGL